MSEIAESFIERYKKAVTGLHPNHLSRWPIINGHDTKHLLLDRQLVLCFIDTRNPIMSSTSPIPGDLKDKINSILDSDGKPQARNFIRKSLGLSDRDSVVILEHRKINRSNESNGTTLSFEISEVDKEVDLMLEGHRMALGLSKNKIFLSHKGKDKSIVRSFKATLDLLGFSPWLDEDAMPAGTSLDRGILQGFEDSCGVVFFITPNFVDENYLATEIEYAISQKRKKGDKFQIITLVMGDHNGDPKIPDLLMNYVYKTPQSDLEALREILKALPVSVSEVIWK